LSIFDCTCGILWRLFVIRNHKSKDLDIDSGDRLRTQLYE
jgi:hypothetical protein